MSKNFKNLSYAEHKALRDVLGATGIKLHQLQVRVERIERDAGPDGAVEYVPLTEAYERTRHLGPHTLRRLGIKAE